MNIVKENKDELNAVLKITVSEEDYEPRIVEELKKQRKKAQIKGFRPGKVPLGLIRKMLGSSIKMQEIDKIISEELSKYMMEEKTKILGQPLPSDEQKAVDIENNKEYEFIFDIGLTPEFELKPDEISTPYYIIKIEDDVVKKEIERYQNQFAKTEVSDVTKDKSYLKGDIKQIDENGDVIEGGIAAEETMLAIDIIKDDEIKEKFVGVNINDKVNFDIKKAFPNDTEIAGILKIDKDKLTDIQPNFQYEIKEITTYTPAELNQEFFDKVYGKDTVKSEEEFTEKIKEGIRNIYKNESDYRFNIDVKKKILEKVDISLPDEFLKKWLKATDKEGKYTPEILEKEYPEIAKEFKWQLIKEKITEEQNIEVTEEDIRNESRKFTEAQFAQYGIPLTQLGEDGLNSFIDKNLEKEEDRNRFAQQSAETKVFDYLRGAVKLENKELAVDELKKLYDAENKQIAEEVENENTETEDKNTEIEEAEIIIDENEKNTDNDN